MISTVPTPSLTSTGFTMPQESEILQALLSDINSAFGGTLNVAYPECLSTPQGQLATTIAAIIADKDRLFLQYANLVDPTYSYGRMQDALGRLYFIYRKAAGNTTVDCVCSGLPGTAIPINSQAKDTAGQTYFAVSGGVIGAGGTATLSFANILTGPVACAALSLTSIYGAVNGWSGISNPLAGVLGNDVETAQEFETRRKASVAVNANGSMASVYGAVASVPSVSDVYIAQNVKSTIQIIGGISIAAHSVYVAAVGGSDQSIGEAIWQKASLGCDYTGNTTVTVSDTTYATPNPVYIVAFTRPANYATKFRVSLYTPSDLTKLPSDWSDLVKSAIYDSMQITADGEQRPRIGGTVYGNRFIPVVSGAFAGAEAVSILVGHTTADQISMTCNIDELPCIATTSDIIVVLV